MGARFLIWLTTEHWRIGAGLLRVNLGAWAVYFYLLHWPYRAYLWGPTGILPFERFVELNDSINVFAWNSSSIYFESVYLTAIIVAVLVVIGFLPRLIIPVHWFMIWSMQERNPFLGDGGDNLMRIVLFFLVLVNTGSILSVHAVRSKNHQVSYAFFTPALAVTHNIGVLLILVQLCMMYMSTGLYKVMGELWQNGTALYYILRVEEFSWPGVAEFIYRNTYLVVAGTYTTVLFEILFAPSLLNRWTRYLMIAAGSLFHAGIAALMGLVTFGWSMLSIYPLLVTDREYRELAAWSRRRFRLTVLYDADCAFCSRTVRLMDAANLLSLVEFVPFQQPGILTHFGIPLARAEQRMQSITPDGSRAEGMDSMVQICGRSPLLWPLLPMLWTGRLLFGHRPYDLVADRRYLFTRGACAFQAGRAEKEERGR